MSLPLTAEQRREGWKRQPSKPMPAFGRELSETERLYRAPIEREKVAKKAEGLAKLAAWKQDNPELVEAQKQLAKIKRRKKRNGKPGHRCALLARH
jgi:hypothetical protein